MTDDPLKICKKCEGELVRLIGTGLKPVFKGNGFYETDYKNNKSKGKKPTKPISNKSDKSESTKTTTKKSA